VAGVITHQKIQFNFLITKIQKRHLMNRRIKIATTTLALILVATFNAVAQPYGHSEYVNANVNYRLSKGLYYQATTPGYIMAGYTPTNSAYSPNVVVYRTSPGGGLSGSTAWTNGYWVNDCSSNTPTTCLEMNITECDTSIYHFYNFAVSFVNLDALYIFGIDDLGVPTGPLHHQYSFPSNCTNVTRPYLVQLANSDMVVCGSYSTGGLTYMYIIKIDNSGIVITSKTYKLSSGVSIIPNDLIVSSFNNFSNFDLAIVGTFNDGSNDAGFLMIYDHNAAVINQISQYNVNASSNETFGGITISNSGTGSYIINGVTDATSSGGPRPVGISVQANGITTNWSNWYTTTGITTICVPSKIIERANTNSSYDYFLASSINAGAKVCKIEPNGNWCSSTYNDGQYGGNTGFDCHSLSYNNNPGNDEGLHVYGNNPNNNFFLVQAHFNIRTNPSPSGYGCGNLFETPNTYSIVNTSANLSQGPSLLTSNGPTECGIGIGFTYESVTHNQLCGGDNFDILGDNQRKTSIVNQSNQSIKIQPTIANSLITVEGKSNFKYSLVQTDGKIVANGESNGTIQVETIPNGMYILVISDPTSSFSQKIIINH